MSKPAAINNFGHNIRLQPTAYYEPSSEREVLDILDRHAGEKIRVIGSRHSWGHVLDATGVVLQLRQLDDVLVESGEGGTWAVIGAGCQIKQVLAKLAKQGLTLPSLGLITEQTIAGAASTGTHGSGKHSLSHYVDAVRIAVYDSESGRAVIREINSEMELRAAHCSLGSLGVILSVKMQIRPCYNVEEFFRETRNLDEVLSAEQDYPLQQFYFAPWRWSFIVSHRRETERKRSRLAVLFRWYWFLLIDVGLHLMILLAIRVLHSVSFLKFLFRNVFGRFIVHNWHVVDDASVALIMEHELFRHIEIEIFVRRSCLSETLTFVRHLLEVCDGEEPQFAADVAARLQQAGLDTAVAGLKGTYTHHYPICVRRVLPDDTLISMASSWDEPCYAVSLISYQAPSRREGFMGFADVLARTSALLFDARPHWGKVCPIQAETAAALYPKLDDFRAVRKQLDPQAVFSNSWLEERLFNASHTAPRKAAGPQTESNSH